MIKYDAIIIGSGQAGTPLAKKLAKAGWKTILIEKRWVGGTCINDGCTPTKTLVASARMAYLAGKSSNWGIHIDHFSIDLNAVMKKKENVIHTFRNGSEKGILKTENLELLYGTATFTNDKTLSVALNDGGTKELGAEHIFINTGGKTIIPPIAGLENIQYLTSTSILELEEIPKHLLIIGGAYISMEFGQMFRRFGSEVTILENSPRILPKEDEDVAESIMDFLQEEGIVIYSGAKTDKIEQDDNGTITLSVNINGALQQINCSHVLVAAGRTPDIDHLGLEKSNIHTDKGHITVNDKLETSVPGIYALGDVKGGPAFTHVSYNDYIIVAKNLLDNADITTAGRLIPYCMFTDPQLGRVGMTEEEARKNGLDIKVAKLPMAHVARAIETGETKGFMKAVVDTVTGKILGAAVIGTEGGEVMTVLQMAMMGGITYDVIRNNIFAHPLFSESLNNLFMPLDN